MQSASTSPYTLRVAGPDDAAGIAAIYAPYVEESFISFEYDVPAAEEMARRMAEGLPQFPWLCCVEEEMLIGYAYAGHFGKRRGYDWAAEASIYIQRQRRQNGAGCLLYTALMNLLRLQGYKNLYGIIASPNPQSESFHEKMGFVRQGMFLDIGYKFGQPMGVACYGKPLAPPAKNPPPPTPFSQLPAQQITAVLRAATWASGGPPAAE